MIKNVKDGKKMDGYIFLLTILYTVKFLKYTKLKYKRI